MSRKEPNLHKRGKIWHLKIERNGKTIRESTGESTLAAARDYRDRALEKLKRLKNGNREELSYDMAMEQFLNHCDSHIKKSSVKRYEVSARALYPHFTGRKLADITKADILHALDKRKREVTGSAVNRDRALLSSMFTFACDRDYVAFNPVLAVKKHRENEARTRNLSLQEFETLHKAAPALLGDMMTFDVETGLRVSELVFLKWSEIDLSKQEVTPSNTKSGHARQVPLSDRALAILSAQIRHIKSPYVFHHQDGKPYRNAPRAFSELANQVSLVMISKAKTPQAKEEAVKLQDVIFHDLRRTFTCWHYSKGVALPVLSKLLGHSTYAVTEKHYSFLQQEDLHKAIRGNVTKSSQAQGTVGVNLSKSSKERKTK
jgi:integrase